MDRNLNNRGIISDTQRPFHETTETVSFFAILVYVLSLEENFCVIRKAVDRKEHACLVKKTELVVNKGVDIVGMSMREHLEAISHIETISCIRRLKHRTRKNNPLDSKKVGRKSK